MYDVIYPQLHDPKISIFFFNYKKKEKEREKEGRKKGKEEHLGQSPGLSPSCLSPSHHPLLPTVKR